MCVQSFRATLSPNAQLLFDLILDFTCDHFLFEGKGNILELLDGDMSRQALDAAIEELGCTEHIRSKGTKSQNLQRILSEVTIKDRMREFIATARAPAPASVPAPASAPAEAKQPNPDDMDLDIMELENAAPGTLAAIDGALSELENEANRSPPADPSLVCLFVCLCVCSLFVCVCVCSRASSAARPSASRRRARTAAPSAFSLTTRTTSPVRVRARTAATMRARPLQNQSQWCFRR